MLLIEILENSFMSPTSGKNLDTQKSKITEILEVELDSEALKEERTSRKNFDHYIYLKTLEGSL